jgi:trk system potassium uptake protein TrkA
VGVKMHFIVAGLSDIGRNLAEILYKEGVDTVVVDSDEAKCAEVAASSDMMIIRGDATERSVLEEARVKNATAVVALTNDDSDNLMICMLAKEAGAKRVISILNEAVHAEAFKRAGIDVQVKPDAIVAKHIYYTTLRPYVKDFFALGRAELFETEVEAGMRCVGKKIPEIETPRGVKILWLERRGEYLNEATKIEPNDRLTLIFDGKSSNKASEFMSRCFAKG